MTGRSSIIVRLGRILQVIPLWLFGFVEWPFVALVGRLKHHTPAIFLLALPRSGSTLTYQCICHGLSVNYLSNLWNVFYQLPLYAGWFSGRNSCSHRSDFRSQHGFVPGLDGPAEGLRFWRWWLGCGLSDEDCDSLSVAKLQRRTGYLRRVFSVLSKNNSPFATAYLGHILVPDRLNQAFPGAVLVRLRREPIANALSLLESSRASHSDWFSVKPNECYTVEATTEHTRVAAQVYWLNRRLDEATCVGKMLTIQYERLCENPRREVNRIRTWCNENGVPVARKLELPERFEYKEVNFTTDVDAVKIREALDKLIEKYGALTVVE